MAKAPVFVREATGLVRSWKARDAFMFNVLTMAILSGGAYDIVTASGVFPGGNLIFGILLTGALGTTMWTTYVLLSSAMPRSGGDWVFQSRVLLPSVASAIIIGDIFYLVYWDVFGTFYAVAGGMGPFFTLLGTYFNSATFSSFGTWMSSGVGWSFFIAGMIILFVAGWQLVLPIRYYARVQWFLMGSVMAGVIVVIVAFLATSHSAFVSDFNQFSATLTGKSDYYQTVVNQAATSGGSPTKSFNWFDQVGILPVTWSLLAWAFWSAQFNGEIKGAGSIKTQNVIMNGSGWFTALIWALMAFALFNMAGTAFVNSASYLTGQGTFALPVGAYVTMYVAALGGATPSILILVALLIIMIAFIANGYQIFYNTMGGPIRMGFAMSFDRLLPSAFAKVSKRWSTPVNFTLITIVIAIGELGAAAFYPQYAPLIVPATLSSGAIPYVFTCLSGALLPWRQKHIYESSPAAKYKVGNIPLITITGLIAVAFNILIAYYWLTVPALGLSNYGVLVFVVGAYVFGAVYYFIFKYYRARNNVDISLAFKEIPPE
jgi:basic amino acid/polyamine antiporter, APA family